MAGKMDSTFVFNAPQTSVFGKQALDQLPQLVKDFEVDKVLVVTDGFFVKNGLISQMTAKLEDEGIQVSVFADVQPDPTLDNVYEGLDRLLACEAGLIIGIGGGSPIDAAKAISILATNPKPLQQYMGYHKIKYAAMPLIAIPTTAGTGSEATKVAVITDSVHNVKMMMLDKHLMPTASIVDYTLTMSMPGDLTAYVGVDTLTHGIEAYVSKKANPISDPLAMACIKAVSRHMKDAWNRPDSEAARYGMSTAAYLGGIAFTNSSVCLVHGMSRPLGAVFHLAHGFSNAILLPTVVEYSIHGAPERYAEIAREMGYAQPGQSTEAAGYNLIKGLKQLNKELQIPKLGECGKVDYHLFRSSLEKMASDALASGSPLNNPIVPTVEEIVDLYLKAW
jgi:alcohol dehydrogenase class IV